jgi:hypothetical protein
MKNILRYLRKFLLSNVREENVAKYFFEIICKFHTRKKIYILDFGSGFEPNVAILLKKKLKNSRYEVFINCYDFYTNVELKKLNYSKNLKFNQLKDLEFDKKKYDFAIISDVLHHIGVKKYSILKRVLKLLKCKSKFLLIKDHFEYSIFSRLILIFMDFIGNYYNNVKIPKSYFRKNKFNELIKLVNLKIIAKIENKKYYSNKFLFFNNPNLQFIYLLK